MVSHNTIIFRIIIGAFDCYYQFKVIQNLCHMWPWIKDYYFNTKVKIETLQFIPMSKNFKWDIKRLTRYPGSIKINKERGPFLNRFRRGRSYRIYVVSMMKVSNG